MDAINLAQAERKSVIDEVRVKIALLNNIPAAADCTHKLGEEVLIFSEER